MVQFPAKKLPFMPLFTGPQGTGKNFMLEVIALVIGSWNYLSTTDLEDLYGNHADLWVGKIMINMDEIDEFSTRKYQRSIKKDVDNQSKKSVNTKFAKPREESNYALNVGTSNKPNPVGVDSDSGDRRFVYFVPGKKYKHKKGAFWDDMWKKCSRPEFIAAFYDYLTNIDVSGYDFKTERLKVLTPRYYAWIGQNQCAESKVLAAFCHTLRDKGVVYLTSVPKQYALPEAVKLDDKFSIDKTYAITKTSLFEYYRGLMQEEGQHYKLKSNFDAAIINMGLSSMVHKPKKNGYPAWEFNAQQLLEELKENGNVKAMEESDGVSTQGL